MKIKDFIEKVDSLYMGSSMETHVYCNGYETMLHWVGTQNYTYKDTNGNDKILKRIDDRSYYSDSVLFNVIACFDMMGDEFDSYYHWLSRMMDSLQDSLNEGEMTEEDELYIMCGQSIHNETLYEITDISYSSDRLGYYITIYTKPISVNDAVKNIKDTAVRIKFRQENGLSIESLQ